MLNVGCCVGNAVGRLQMNYGSNDDYDNYNVDNDNVDNDNNNNDVDDENDNDNEFLPSQKARRNMCYPHL